MNRIRHHVAYPPRQMPAIAQTRVTGRDLRLAAGGGWSDTEIALLARIYPSTPNVFIAERLGRTQRAVTCQANELGLVKTAC